MKRTVRVLSSLALALLAGSAAHAKDLPSYNAAFDKKILSSPPSTARASNLQRAFVASTDARSGAPAFVWGAAAGAPGVSLVTTPEMAARAHLGAHGELYGLSPAALATARLVRVHDTGRGGIIVVLRQELGGVPVFQQEAKVLLRRDRSLVALSGSLHPLAIHSTKSAAPFALPVPGAVARALSDLYEVSLSGSAVVPSSQQTKGDHRLFDLAAPGQGGLATLRFDRPARARKVYFPLSDRLVPAYHVELFASEAGAEQDAYAYVVAADDGRILSRQNLGAHASFKYRVFADETGDKRPLDGPIADFTPHPTGVPDGSYPGFVAPVLITMEGFNKNADPWLAEGATETRGNNVDAYTDHDDSNGLAGGDLRASLTAPGEFDRVYDTSKEPLDSPDQQMAAVTQIFYTINWLHDYWYDSGFDEKAGNAQKDNYGRGGDANDPLLVEAQDGGAKNNANMATPSDGASPRMQMYLWDGEESRSLVIAPSMTSINTGAAEFGPQSYEVTGEVVLADDGMSSNSNACEPLVNDVAGKVVLVDRGDCAFHAKAIAVQNAGGIAMILANNQGGGPPNLVAADLPDVTIPAMSISQTQGNSLKTKLGQGPVSVTLARQSEVDADGTLDNLIVAHEWGHYLHHRLVSCGLKQCGGESEGWGDFVALTMQLREGDNLEGAFSDAVYATVATGDAAYYGTRRAPYSVNMAINPLTFKHIQQGEPLPSSAPLSSAPSDNSEVHNAGEVWASMLFEGYVALLKQSQGPSPRYSFDEARRRMADYVVAGMILAPVEPTFTEQRDGIIAAAYTADPADGLLIAEGFARRGAGSCAESPPADSFDNQGVVESFDVAPAVSITDVQIDDSADSCDGDGLLDAHETGRITVSLANRGFLEAPNTKVKVTSSLPGVTFPNGSETMIEKLGAFATETLTFDVLLDPAQKLPGTLELTVTAENAAACNPSVSLKRALRANYDNAKESAAGDDFESDLDVWKRSGKDSDLIWARETEANGNHLWHGVDYSSLSDTSMVSPEIEVSATESFVVAFKHRYKFETSPENPQDPSGELVFWDGSVIEITSDGGATWDDISDYVDPGYGGKIGNLAENPLAERDAYVDQNPSWPDADSVSLDFGAQLAGKTVRLRFRIGSDQAASEVGWLLDDVSFTGIEGTPFPSVVKDAASCSPIVDHAPIADAGPDQTVKGGATVTLDGAKSSDPDGDELALVWSQTDGAAVELAAKGTKATFVAPAVSKDTTLVFALKASANELSSDDTVKILVLAGDGDALAITGGGCGCAVPGDDELPAAPLGALGALSLGLVAMRRRRSNAKS